MAFISATLDDEPISLAGTYTIYAMSALIYGFGFVALAYTIYHRNYPPLKAKHVPFISLAFLGCFFWYIGELHSIGILGYSAPIFNACLFWDVWIQLVLGIHLFMVVLVLRLYSLYHVFVRHRAISDIRFLPPLVLFYIPSIAIALFASVSPHGTAVYFDAKNGFCAMREYFKAANLVFYGAGLLVLGWLTWALRNIRRGFNEFSEQRIGFYIALVTILVNALVIMTGFSYRAWGKYLLVAANMLGGNIYLWLVIGQPLYGCVFRRDECLLKFIEDLNLDSYETPKVQIGSPQMRSTAFFRAQSAGGQLIPIGSVPRPEQAHW